MNRAPEPANRLRAAAVTLLLLCAPAMAATASDLEGAVARAARILERTLEARDRKGSRSKS